MSDGASIILSNVLEGYLPFVRTLDPPSRRTWELACARTSSLAVSWCGDEKLVVTPQALDPDFVTDVARIIGAGHVECVTPSHTGESLSHAVLHDELVLDTIRRNLRRGATLRAWSWTREVCALRDLLASEVGNFQSESPPGSSHWSAAYLDSKSGFRDSAVRDAARQTVLNPPFGWICSDLETAIDTVYSWNACGLGAVVKADRGAGGVGTVVLPPTTPRQRIGALLTVAARMCRPLARGPLVIEELVRCGNQPPTTVSVFAVTNARGETVVQGHSRFAASEGGRYLGAIVGRNALESPIRERLDAIANVAGRIATELGYIGPFGVDGLVGDGDQVRCIELNARRTLATHLYDVGVSLAGPAWQNVIALASADRIELGKHCESYGQLREQLAPSWYPIAGAHRGVFVASMDPPSSMGLREVGLVAIGEEARDASDLLRAAHRALGADIAPALDRTFPSRLRL